MQAAVLRVRAPQLEAGRHDCFPRAPATILRSCNRRGLEVPSWRAGAAPQKRAQEQVANALEDDAEVMSNTRLEKQLAGQPPEIRDEIIAINTDARPLALQVALLVPILAGLLGLLNGLRMMRRPDPAPSEAAEMALG